MFHQVLCQCLLLVAILGRGIVLEPYGVRLCTFLQKKFDNCTCTEFESLNLRCTFLVGCQRGRPEMTNCAADTSVNVQTKTNGLRHVARGYQVRMSQAAEGELHLFTSAGCLYRRVDLIFRNGRAMTVNDGFHIGRSGRKFTVIKGIRYSSVHLGPLRNDSNIFTLMVMGITKVTLHVCEKRGHCSELAIKAITKTKASFTSSSEPPRDMGVSEKFAELQLTTRLTVVLCPRQTGSNVYINSKPPLVMPIWIDRGDHLQVFLTGATLNSAMEVHIVKQNKEEILKITKNNKAKVH